MIEQYIKRIREVYPELLIDHYQSNEIGQNNDVLMINNSLVFRFPKYSEGITQLKKETELLNVVREQVNMRVPEPMYLSFKPEEPGKVFTGYELIPGSPLWGKNLNKLDHGNKKKLASQLVTFLTDLHTISIDQLTTIVEPDQKDAKQVFSELYEQIKDNLFSFMSARAIKEVTKLFEDALNDSTLFSYNPCLVHGDFGASNIIWDKDICEITGIIDFGGSDIGDPAYDFAGILSSYGENFFNMCIDLYPNGNQLAKRVKFYKGTFALQEALHGVIHNDSEAFEDGIRDYKK